MSAYHFKYFQNIQFKNHGIAPAPPDLPTLKAYPTPSVGSRFEIFSLKWRERMNLKVPGAILPLGCAILSTRAITVRGVGTTPLRRTRVNIKTVWYRVGWGWVAPTPSPVCPFPDDYYTLTPGRVVGILFFAKMSGKDAKTTFRSPFKVERLKVTKRNP